MFHFNGLLLRWSWWSPTIMARDRLSTASFAWATCLWAVMAKGCQLSFACPFFHQSHCLTECWIIGRSLADRSGNCQQRGVGCIELQNFHCQWAGHLAEQAVGGSHQTQRCGPSADPFKLADATPRRKMMMLRGTGPRDPCQPGHTLQSPLLPREHATLCVQPSPGPCGAASGKEGILSIRFAWSPYNRPLDTLSRTNGFLSKTQFYTKSYACLCKLHCIPCI